MISHWAGAKLFEPSVVTRQMAFPAMKPTVRRVNPPAAAHATGVCRYQQQEALRSLIPSCAGATKSRRLLTLSRCAPMAKSSSITPACYRLSLRRNNPQYAPALLRQDTKARCPCVCLLEVGACWRFITPRRIFTAPEKAAFRYRLRGAGDEWIEAGTHHHEAYFTKLRPGNYNFEVIAANHHGLWVKGPQSLLSPSSRFSIKLGGSTWDVVESSPG